MKWWVSEMQDNGDLKKSQQELLLAKSLHISVTHGETSSSYWRTADRRRWTIILFFGSSLVYAARTILPLAAVQVATEFEWNKAETGFVLGSFFCGYPILQIFGGALSDRIGGDHVIFKSAIAWSTIALITPFVPYLCNSKTGTINSMALFRFLMGLAQGVHFPSMSSLISRRAPPEYRATTVGVVFAAGSFGPLLSGSIGSLLLEYVSWHSVFYLFGSLGLIWAAVLNYYSKKQRKLFKVQELSRTKQKTAEKTLPFIKVVQILMKHSAFWAMIYSHLCHGCIFFMILSWFPTYFKETFPEAKGWIFNVVPSLLALPASMSSGLFADKLIARKKGVGFSRKVIHSISCCGLSFSLLLIGEFHSFSACLILAGLALFSQAFSNGGVSVNPNDIAPKHSGMVFGIMNSAGAINSFITTYIAGVILHRTNSWRLVYDLAAAVTLSSWFVFVTFAQGHPIVS